MVVPEGTTITLPGRAGLILPDELGQAIELNDWEAVWANPEWAELMEGSASHLPGAEVPDLLLRAPDGIAVFENSIRVAADTPLSSMLRAKMGHMCWAACRRIPGGLF